MTDYSAKIAALEEAAGSGELTIEADGRKITYRSMKELLAALDYFKGQVAASSGQQAYAATYYSEG